MSSVPQEDTKQLREDALVLIHANGEDIAETWETLHPEDQEYWLNVARAARNLPKREEL